MSEATPTIFVVDDDASPRQALKSLIRSVGFSVELFASTNECVKCARPDAPSCLVLDVRLAGQSGLDFRKELTNAGIHYSGHIHYRARRHYPCPCGR